MDYTYCPCPELTITDKPLSVLTNGFDGTLLTGTTTCDRRRGIVVLAGRQDVKDPSLIDHARLQNLTIPKDTSLDEITEMSGRLSGGSFEIMHVYDTETDKWSVFSLR